jgi:hypothetical protein
MTDRAARWATEQVGRPAPSPSPAPPPAGVPGSRDGGGGQRVCPAAVTVAVVGEGGAAD